MVMQVAEPFDIDDLVPSGEIQHLRYGVGETYLGDTIEIPVTIINGEHDGPRFFFTAAIHGDELNGVKVVQEIADQYAPDELHGTLVCVHVCNIPAYQAQQRYIPIYDHDLNRAFPGHERRNMAERMAKRLYDQFVAPCDFGLDFHTSTRNRTTMFHVRADLDTPAVEELATAFAANLVLYGGGDAGSLRSVATTNGIPTITIEMGRAHRFQPILIDRALRGVESVLATYDVLPDAEPDIPAWYKTTSVESEKRWIRADRGGLVEMQWGPHPIVREGEPICTITDHFKTNSTTVEAPFTGLVIGALENPVAAPGHPLCHLVRIDEDIEATIAEEVQEGSFDGYRIYDGRWMID